VRMAGNGGSRPTVPEPRATFAAPAAIRNVEITGILDITLDWKRPSLATIRSVAKCHWVETAMNSSNGSQFEIKSNACRCGSIDLILPHELTF
jgi:hypothetical protein